MALIIDGQPPTGDVMGISFGNLSAVGEMVTDQIMGEDVEFGDVVYLNADEKWYKAAAVFGKLPANGMVVYTVVSGKTTTLLMRGFARKDTWQFGTDVGHDLYLNTAIAGELSGIDPGNDYNQIIGTVYRTNIVYFNPK